MTEKELNYLKKIIKDFEKEEEKTCIISVSLLKEILQHIEELK